MVGLRRWECMNINFKIRMILNICMDEKILKEVLVDI